MSDLLQKYLKEKTNQSNNLRLLQAQWDYDQQLLGKALQNVGQMFSHYSRHDASHSTQILINIERILGEKRIKNLSATNIWLLLEAAYWHDVGMVVTKPHIDDAFKQDGFTQFLEKMVYGEISPHQQLAKVLLKQQKQGANDTDAIFNDRQLDKHHLTPWDAVLSLKFLLAEYFREKHPERSALAVNQPSELFGINSPRTELIPKRLYTLLGNICLMHGRGFNDILTQLHHAEMGVGNDECHPRFVACMLRMGDLLDMDDNRFCPVMQGMAGENRPPMSKAHEHKHASLQHFLLNSDRIEIIAKTSDVDGYNQQWQWVKWLKEEWHSQMENWQDIVPNRQFGLLPALGKIEVQHGDNQILLEQGKRNEFKLNAPKIMALLKGDNIYKPEDAWREVIQNAIDATLIRAWFDHKNTDAYKQLTTPQEQFNFFCQSETGKLKDYPIHIEFSQVEPEANEQHHDGNTTPRWQMEIIDAGVGINREALTALTTLGQSRSRVEYQAMINDMPEWLKPSGTFGIGLQSLFMHTDTLHIKTRHCHDNEALDITLHSPTGKKQGLVEINKSDRPAHERKIGTRVRFELLPVKDKDEYGQIMSMAMLGARYDLIADPVASQLPWQAIAHIQGIVKNTMVPINCILKSEGYKAPALENCDQPTETNGEWEFIPETCCQIKGLTFVGEDHFEQMYFRGQLFECHFGLPFVVSYEINLLNQKASDWLTIDRNKLKEDEGKMLWNVLFKTCLYWLKNHLSDLNEEEKQYASAFLSYHKRPGAIDKEDKEGQKTLNDLLQKIGEDWKKIKVLIVENGNFSDPKKETIEDALKNRVGFNFIAVPYERNLRLRDSNKVKQGKFVFVESDLLLSLIRVLCFEYNQRLTPKGKVERIYEPLRLDSRNSGSGNEGEQYLTTSLERSFKGFNYDVADVDDFSGVDGFNAANLKRLVLKDGVECQELLGESVVGAGKAIYLPYLPFPNNVLHRKHNNKNFLSYVKRHLIDPKITIEEIEQIYTELDAAISALMKRTGSKEAWENRFEEIDSRIR